MATLGRLRRLQKAMQGNMDCIELAASLLGVEPEAATVRELFGYFADSLRAVHREEPRPEPPEILKAVANATDRESAFRQAYSQAPMPWCPLDITALVERGELVPRSLVAGRPVDEPIRDLAE